MNDLSKPPDAGTASPPMTAGSPALPARLILFDGLCGFCAACVQFIIRYDRPGSFRFAPLQSFTGRRLCQQAGLNPDDFDTFLYVRQGGPILMRSDAALAVAYDLGGRWRLLTLLRFIPKPLRDAAYQAFARRRYQWFGQLESCVLPTAIPGGETRFWKD